MFPSPTTALDWTLDPLTVVKRWPVDRPLLALHSGRLDPSWSRWSIFACPDGRLRCHGDPGHGHSQYESETTEDADIPGDLPEDPLDALATVTTVDPDSLWLGTLSYDLGRWIENLPNHANDDRQWPTLAFDRCPGWLIHDRQENRWSAAGIWADKPPAFFQSLVADGPTDWGQTAADPAPPKSIFSESAYRDAVQRVLDYIGAGDIFQANLAQRFTSEISALTDPRAARRFGRRLFAKLC
ncbi:MAG: hypothetical protein R3336_08410 [Phycisphaeraceae bacterium]|nr:hypothetical protein [Phycisphaeraceae bacterium]